MHSIRYSFLSSLIRLLRGDEMDFEAKNSLVGRVVGLVMLRVLGLGGRPRRSRSRLFGEICH